jgi:hypothetical protein
VRMRNIWFDCLSFLVAVLMFGYAVFSLVEYLRSKDGSFFGAALTIGMFLLFSALYVWLSLRVGEVQRRVREKQNQSRGDNRESRRNDANLNKGER